MNSNPSGARAPLASVVVPVLNGIGRVEDLVGCLATQRCQFSWDLTFVDSGSSDGTRSWIESRTDTFPVPLRVVNLDHESFDHGDTRNFGAALTDGEILVFLTDDARPLGTTWLASVVASIDEDGAGAVYCRNVVPAGTPAWAATLAATDPVYRDAEELPPASEGAPRDPLELRRQALYCDTASAIRRSILDAHPYPRADAGEDMLLARALRESGVEVRQLDHCPVEHVHVYTRDQLRHRVLLDGRFNKEAFGREILQPSNTGATSDLVAQLLESCDPVLAEQLGESDTPEEQRTVLKGQLQAFVEGASAGLAMASGRRWPTSMLASARVRVGLVHGDPEDPAVVALAAALATLGFDVARLHANGLEREVDDLDLVHVLIEGESADVLSQVPCLVPGTDGWRMHLFGLQAAPHGAHARPELCIPVTANPLDESPRVAAARWAFRYRQLICMSKAREAYERWGFEADHRSGEVRREGEVLATLGPGPARIEFDLPPMGSDVSELLLEVEFVESDLGATRCAIVSLDGKEIALAGALKVSAAPSVATSRVAVQVPTTGGRLAISNRTPSGSLSICRVRGLRLRRSPRGPRDEFLAVSPVPSQPMAEPAKVAVIIVTLAGVPRLEGCLKALGASHYPAERLEVCVVDNGNSAETRQWLQANHPAVRLLVPGTNIGFTQGANLGLTEVADCPVTVFLNDDAEVSADFIGELIQPVLAGTCSAAAARMILPDGTPEYFGGAGSFQGLAFGGPEDAVRARDLDHARKTLFACGGAMAIDTEIFRAVGGFDEDYFAYYDDIDLGWRLWILGYEVHYVPTAVCTHARSSTSSTFPPESIRLLQVRNALCTCIKNLGDDALRATLPALLALAARRLWIQAERPYVGKLRIELLQPMPVRDALRRLLGTRFGITRMAMADLAGMQDVLGDWDKWMAKRERIQSSRKRLDADVLPLFLDPLRCVEGEAEYEALQSSLVRLFDLERVFGAS